MQGFDLKSRSGGLAFKEDMRFFFFKRLSEAGTLVHGFTTRTGGVSTGPYESLNMAFHVGDRPENVVENRERALYSLGVDPGCLVAGEQVHGDKVLIVGSSEKGRGALNHESALPGVDALVTKENGVALASFYADCVPLFFWDPVKGVAAMAHAGWKGTLLNIGPKTIKEMVLAFGCRPRDIIAGIGPSIGPCCYEVGEGVARAFYSVFNRAGDFIRIVRTGRYRLDLWQVNKISLIESGIEETNIEAACLCTSCHRHLFFSYRAQGGVCGRMAAVIMLV